jgi:rhodanese-related sulfurtransferase
MPDAEEISATEAIARDADGAWLLDVREQVEWDAGHAPSATLIPMGELSDRIGEVPDDAPILVVCHTGYRSWVVTKALVNAGYDAVNVAGGMEAWESAGGVVVRDGQRRGEA